MRTTPMRVNPQGDVLGAALLIFALHIAPAGAQVAKPARPAQDPVFQTSQRCVACHNKLLTPSGEEISIGFEWSASMMANSARDPYWQAAVRRETLDHPTAGRAIEAECSICHMPMARYEAHLVGAEGQVFAHLKFDPNTRSDQLAADGVSCSLCHQIARDKLGTRESFVGRFVIAGAAAGGLRQAFGPYEVDVGHARIMSSSSGFRPVRSEHIQQSELCASCHTLITHSLDASGKVIGEFPEQVPYQEWLHSRYRQTRSCQDCHMPAVGGQAPITAVLSVLREGVSRHLFLSGNFFVQRMLNRFRHELAVSAGSQSLEMAARKTLEHLRTEAAQLTIQRTELRAGRLEADIVVENLAGHKLPTAYPSRRVWLRILVRDAGKRVVFESGAFSADGSIRGNDNDADPQRYEPHYKELRTQDQVQIYEAVLADPSGAVTTGLLRAARYLKDNRLLPKGFDKYSAGKDIAVWGAAAEDPDFLEGGDRLRLSVDVAGMQGPFQIEAELWYQPISYRWAHNFRPYSAEEPRRFLRYFEAMAPDSAALLVRASATH